MKILDLDILKPEQQLVKLGGHEIDVSFIPLGITFQIDEIVKKSMALDQAKLQDNDTEEIEKAFNLSVDLCVAFCGVKYRDLDHDWFMQNANVQQVHALAEMIRETLFNTYAKVGRNGKK